MTVVRNSGSRLLQWLIIIFSLTTLFFGLILRFSNLNLPYWADESQTYNTAHGIDSATKKPSLFYAWKIQRLEMFHPPAFMTMLYYWSKHDTSVAWVRLLPSLIGVLGLFYLFRLGRESRFKLASILLTVSLTAISWVFVHYSEEVSAYSLSMSIVFILGYQLIRYSNQSTYSNFIFLISVSLFNLLVDFGNWVYLPLIGTYLLLEALHRQKFDRIIIFAIAGGLLTTIMFFDQIRYKPVGFAAEYMTRNKLNSVPAAQIPAKFVKDNVDYFTYVAGATPWYLDATFFPSTERFGPTFTRQYYLSLLFVGVVVFFHYLYLSIFHSRNKREILKKILPLLLLLTTLIIANLMSLLGLYPIGAVRMSLFYAPLVIWSFLQYLDLLLVKLNLFSLIMLFFAVILIINGLMRLYRVPQRHIGIFNSGHTLALVGNSECCYPIQSSP